MEKSIINRKDKRDAELIYEIWNKKSDKPIKCPACGENMILSQFIPIFDKENIYTPFDTIIICTSCLYKIRAETFTFNGSVKSFDLNHVEIGSWAPSGCRILLDYEHELDYNLLNDLKESWEIVEFLVVNNQIIKVI